MTDEQLPPIEEDIELVRRFTAPLLERIADLERQLEEARKLLESAPKFFSHHDFDGEKLEWLQAAVIAQEQK